MAQVLGSASLIRSEQPLLPGTRAFPTVLAATPIADLTAPLRWRAQLSVLQGTNQLFALDKPLAELEGQPIALAFMPETQADADILAALMRPEAGGDAATGPPPRTPPSSPPRRRPRGPTRVALRSQIATLESLSVITLALTAA